VRARSLRPTRCGALDKHVIADFLADPAGMRNLAEALRQAESEGDFTTLRAPVADEDYGEEEGRLRLLVRRHVERERSTELRRRKIDSVLRAGAALACEVCGFDLEATYGDRGKGYIDCHHIVPLNVGRLKITRLADLALMCANCHRMIHVRPPWLSPAELRKLMPRTTRTEHDPEHPRNDLRYYLQRPPDPVQILKQPRHRL
jgi:5-methylcytosine-specific restriction protein A